MKVLNLLSTGGVGGIEQLCKNIGKYADYKNTFCFMFGEGIIYNEMKLLGLHVESLANDGKGKVTLSKWKHVCNLVEKNDIIVTHHCSIALQLYYYLLSQKYRNKKFVMTVHSCFEKAQNYNYNSKLKNKSAEYMIKAALKCSDKIIFVSKAGRESYVSNFDISRDKAMVIYNGIEQSARTSDDINTQADRKYQITYIGRVEEIKGIQLLIRAIAVLPEYYLARIKVWIIGDGSYREELEKLTSKLGLNGIIKFLGVKRDIDNYLYKTDIFVYPSICQEVFGISIVEAMSYGIPCIANNVGGIPEIIINGVKRTITHYEDGSVATIKKNCILTSEKFSILNTVRELKKLYRGLY